MQLHLDVEGDAMLPARAHARLEFGAVFTPFEGVPGVTTDHVVHLVEKLLSGPPDAAPVPLDQL